MRLPRFRSQGEVLLEWHQLDQSRGWSTFNFLMFILSSYVAFVYVHPEVLPKRFRQINFLGVQKSGLFVQATALVDLNSEMSQNDGAEALREGFA